MAHTDLAGEVISPRTLAKTIMKALASIVAPFVAILIGMLLKLSLIDQIPRGQQPSVYLMEHYAKDLWLTFFVSSYLAASGLLLKGDSKGSVRFVLVWGPFITFVLSLFFVKGLPQFGLVSNLLTVWIPACFLRCIARGDRISIGRLNMASREHAAALLVVAVVVLIVLLLLFNLLQFIINHPFWSAAIAVGLGVVFVNFLSSTAKASP